MLKLAVIGTGQISHQFIETCQVSKAYKVVAIYSRRLETAQTFASHYNDTIDLYDCLDTFLQADFDVLYIASPNAIHFEQAQAALKASKHIIVEKPAFSTPKEFEAIAELAAKHHCFFFEAARNYHEQAFVAIEQFLKQQTVIGANFSYAKYSSKMPDLLAGHLPNVFSATFSGGALVDLGIYPIYAAYRLFGQPLSAHYKAQKLDNTIDLNGNGRLVYPNFQVSLQTGKNYTTFAKAEIYTEQGTLMLNHIQGIRSAIFHYHKGTIEELPIVPTQLPMLDQVNCFATIIKQNDRQTYQELLTAAKAVNQTLYQMRQSAAIRFEADEQ